MIDFSFSEFYAFVLALVGLILAYLARRKKCTNCMDCQKGMKRGRFKHKKSKKKGHPRQWYWPFYCNK